MSRKFFLTITSVIASAIGCMALFFPLILLESKGVLSNAATSVWMRETGLLILATGITAFLVRSHDFTPTLKAFFSGNIIIQTGLFFIELVAYYSGVITKISGVAPNLTLHAILVFCFLHYLRQKKGKVS
jgi:hypothetical protein